VAAVKPRDAASVLLYRKQGDKTLVLMGRRPSKSRFMPDVYVFPGGAVDAADARAKPATTLSDECAHHMAVAGSRARAQTIAMAAVRETFEETGFKITCRGHPGSVQDETWQTMATQSVSADLSKLSYFARAITPATERIRFHARFFICHMEDIDGSSAYALTQTEELLDLRWVPIENPDDLPLRGVTKFLLKEFSDWSHNPRQWPGHPMYTRRAGKPYVQRS